MWRRKLGLNHRLSDSSLNHPNLPRPHSTCSFNVYLQKHDQSSDCDLSISVACFIFFFYSQWFLTKCQMFLIIFRSQLSDWFRRVWVQSLPEWSDLPWFDWHVLLWVSTWIQWHRLWGGCRWVCQWALSEWSILPRHGKQVCKYVWTSGCKILKSGDFFSACDAHVSGNIWLR